jgi:preprotein translocase subunit SecD
MTCRHRGTIPTSAWVSTQRPHLEDQGGLVGQNGQAGQRRRLRPRVPTIVDTHVASLIAAAFLFQFGTGPIRGFATTLSIGLLSNVFTSVFVSRTLFELVLSRRRAATLSI